MADTGWLSESVPPGVNVPDEEMAELGAADIVKESVIETMERRAVNLETEHAE